MLKNFKKALGIRPSYRDLKEAVDAGDYEFVFMVQTARSEKKEPSAMHCLAVMYKSGLGTEVNIEKYVQLLKEAAELGHVEACWDYLEVLMTDSISENIEIIERLLVKIGESSDETAVGAWRTLGNLFSNGEHIAVDGIKAITYYQQAVQLGDIESINSIGYMYQTGEKVEKNLKEAAEYYSISARLGDQAGQLFLGNLYLNGEGVPKSFDKGSALLTASAEQGNTLAMHLLGMLYLDDNFPHKNTVLAYKWLNIASTEHDFSGTLRQDLEDQLSNEEKLLAQRLSDEWFEAHSIAGSV